MRFFIECECCTYRLAFDQNPETYEHIPSGVTALDLKTLVVKIPEGFEVRGERMVCRYCCNRFDRQEAVIREEVEAELRAEFKAELAAVTLYGSET